MKKTYKYLFTIALNGILCLFVAISANAQRPTGGGGSSSSSGGGSSRPASSGGSSSGGSSARSSYSAPSNTNYRGPSASSVNNSRQSGGVNNARPSYNAGYNYRSPGANSRVAVANPRFNNIGIRNPSYNTTPGYRTSVAPVVTSSYGGRGYVAGTSGYIGAGGRASVGVGGHGFYGPSYWRTHYYYHYNHGYYGTYYAPRIGFSIGFLPYGCYPFYFDDYQYFYSGGLFYQYENNEYTVVEPPVGAEVNTLPSNAQSIVINGQQYYEANGVYYEPITKDDGSVSYQVAGKDGELNTNTNEDTQQAPQVGDLVGQLPPDCRKINLNGEKYYVSPDGYYYQDAKDANNNKVYKIVGTPEEAPSN